MVQRRLVATENVLSSKRPRKSTAQNDHIELEINGHRENGLEVNGVNGNDENIENRDPEIRDDEGIQRRDENLLEVYVDELNRMEIPDAPPPVMSFDGTGPRLLITKIVTENFKSYYGSHTLGPFHKNFTAIVGPNGSGKSNVIDSLLFVFGYRSQKIRSKNISVLIHNSELHPNVGSCTVEVHFIKILDKAGDDFYVIPDSELMVSRTAYKDNSSIYHINKKRVQFRDVANMLRQNGIDIDHNRFLILQGEVEQISLMKPKAQAEGEEGMLEYLEDIIGSSRLKPFIDQIHKRMEELEEMRNDKAHRLKNAEDEKTDLEGPKNEAVSFLEMENDLIRKKNVLFQKYCLESNDNFSKMEHEYNVIKEDYTNKEADIKALQEEMRGKQEHYERLKQKHDEVQKEADKFTAVFKDLEKEDTKLREDRKHAKGKTTTLDAAKEAEKKKLADLKSQPEKCEKQVEESQAKKAQLEEKLKELQTRLDEGMRKLSDETKASQNEKKGMEEQLIARQGVVAEARTQLKLAKGELELCLSAQTNEQKKLDDVKGQLAKTVQALADCEKTIQENGKSIPGMDKALEEMRRQIQDVTNEEKDLNEQVRDKARRIGTATAALQSFGNRNRVLDALFAQQRKGLIKGIYGRLGDLGAIDEKYDVAISTACGPLDNIVVETIDVAQTCVEFLSRNKVGMATFIGLDKMKRFEQTMKQRIQTPEGVPRLFDLVVVEDERLKPAFYYALRDTLVAEDLEQATRIAYQGGKARYRVVTLSGQVIDLSGTMSGGGTRQSRGRMGRSVIATPNKDDLTEDQIKQLQTELDNQRTRLEELRNSRIKLEADVERLERELQKRKLDLNGSKMDITRINEQKQLLEKRVRDQEKKLAETIPDEDEKTRLENKIDKLQRDYDKIAEASIKIEGEVKRVDEVIQEIKERLVGSVEKEIGTTKRQIDDTGKSINKAKVSVKTAHRNIKNSEEKLANIEQDIEDNKAALIRIDERLKVLEDEGAEAVLKRDAALKELKNFETDLQEARTGARSCGDKERKLQEELIDQKARLDNVEQKLNSFQQKKNYWEKEVRKLQLHDIRSMCGLPPEEPRPRPRPIKQERNDDEDSVQENGHMNSSQVEEIDETPGVLKTLSREYLEKVEKEPLTVQVSALEDRLGKMKPNLDVLDEYRMKVEKCQRCQQLLEHVTRTRDIFRGRHEELRDQRMSEFLDGFKIISSKLKEMYQMITLGGDADLELMDSMDPFTEGVAFTVRPPKKSWKSICNLSGGEKTLSSLSLVFALHHYKPTPLYVMDEIDAALDFKNVSIVANYIKERTKNAQFIIISLRNNMFELCDRLVGIYKVNHCTNTAVIDPEKFSLSRPKLV